MIKNNMDTWLGIEPESVRFFLVLYGIFISIITFFYFGWDKIRAELGKRRVSERMLWILTLLGGSLGALAGMHFFRHKTKKLSFQAVLVIIFAVQILILIWSFKPKMLTP